MHPIPSDRINRSAYPVLMKKLGILYEPETDFEKRAAAYAERACLGRSPSMLKPIWIYEGRQ